MSRTYRKNKGEKVRQANERKRKDKKHFGFTDGQHSRTRYDYTIEIVDGKIQRTFTETDKAPIKNIDFVKYGWPCGSNKKLHEHREAKNKFNK